MRRALLGIVAFVSAACGLTTKGPAGAGGCPGTLLGCAMVPDGAWSVSIVTGTGTCAFADSMSETGEVTDQSKQMTLEDGTSNVSIDCSVTAGSGDTFAVEAVALDTTPTSGSTLTIQIPAISRGATMANPAVGVVTFLSRQTDGEALVSQACDFFFTSKNEGVALGQIWVTFDCPVITNGATMSTCDLDQGFALFENCRTE